MCNKSLLCMWMISHFLFSFGLVITNIIRICFPRQSWRRSLYAQHQYMNMQTQQLLDNYNRQLSINTSIIFPSPPPFLPPCFPRSFPIPHYPFAYNTCRNLHSIFHGKILTLSSEQYYHSPF